MNVAPSSVMIFISHMSVTCTWVSKRKNQNTALKEGFILKLNIVSKISTNVQHALDNSNVDQKGDSHAGS